MSGVLKRSAVSPWTGLGAGALAWLLHHQLGSDLIYSDCRLGGPLLTGGLAILCLALAAAGALISWRARHPLDDAQGRPETRRFAVYISLMAAALFSLAILYQALSGFLIPRCYV